MSRIEDSLWDRTTVVRVDLMSRIGREIAAQYGIRGVPTLLVMREGSEMMRQVGRIDDDAVIELVFAAVPNP